MATRNFIHIAFVPFTLLVIYFYQNSIIGKTITRDNLFHA